MYTPAHFEETRLDVMHALVGAHPLASLVTHGEGGLCADHLPFEIDAPGPEAPFGVLRAHVARANPLWQNDGAPALAIFQGPSAYISPNWYEEKRISGKVVPTFNYAVVHAHGPVRAVRDPAWLLALLGRMTTRHEAAQPSPWQLADAPADYMARMLEAIVGIEIVIERIEGKWKTSQNRPRDRACISAALAAQPDGAAMAALVAQRPV